MSDPGTTQSRQAELVTQTLNTIFEQAENDSAPEIVFELQRVTEPTEVEGVPITAVPAGSIVLFVFYRVAIDLEKQLGIGDDAREALMDQLKHTHRIGWQIDFCHNEVGEGALAYRI